MGILHPDQRTYPTTATHGGSGSGVAYGEHPGVAAGTHIPTTQTTATGPAPNTAGPHRHDVLNKLDPSVDSDMSKVSTAAAAGTAQNTHNTNTTHHNRHGVSPAIAAGIGAGLGGGAAHHHNNNNNHGTHGNAYGNTHGTTAPSAAYNNGGLGGGGIGGGGVGGGGLGGGGFGGVGGAGLTGTGHHQNRHNQPVPVTGASGATGPAPNTAGPHRSDLVNRVDPTVDSQTGLRR